MEFQCARHIQTFPGRSLARQASLVHRILLIALAVVILASSSVDAVSQSTSPPVKPVLFIKRWENRTAYPRFFLYRDHFRRHFDSASKENLSQLAESHSQSRSETNSAILAPTENPTSTNVENSEENNEYTDDDDIATLERLLAERNGVVPKIINAKISPEKGVDEHKKIVFPKDRTNPCNRLQINPDEAESQTEQPSQNATVSQEDESPVSLELGNRENFSSSPSISSNSSVEDDEEMIADLIKDAVPTVDLTLNIIRLSEWKDENVVFSPLSIANVLSMLLLGAGGETSHELAALLERNNSTVPTSRSITKYHISFKRLLNYLRVLSGSDVDLSVASEIFVDSGFPVKEEFEKNLLKYYEAPLHKFNFGVDGKAFQYKVNQWVREKTRNQIQKIMDEPPSPFTTMGVINAIYFKGSWEMPFSEKLTKWREFHVQPSEKTRVEMMLNIISVPYVERESYEMLALPYRENRTGLYVILPKGNDGINDLMNVEKILTRDELSDSILNMNTTKVAVSLPKLKYSSDGRMEEILQNMRVPTVFSPSHANFSGISSSGLYISSLFHRAVIEINEKGTVASAVSLGTGDRIIDDLPIPFRCDKPFIFFIYHLRANTILFWGRVIRPSHLPNT